MYEEKEEILYLEDMYCLRSISHTCVTVRIERLFYRIPRVKLTLIEGFYKKSEEIDKALEDVRWKETKRALEEAIRRKESSILPEDYPKHFELICRPRDFLILAKILTKICKPDE